MAHSMSFSVRKGEININSHVTKLTTTNDIKNEQLLHRNIAVRNSTTGCANKNNRKEKVNISINITDFLAKFTAFTEED